MHTIWDINAAALKVFLDLGTQWRVVPVGGGMAPVTLMMLGLDYAAVDALLRRRKIDDEALFDDLRTMEGAAIKAFAGAGA